jgi:hypothetical protein
MKIHPFIRALTDAMPYATITPLQVQDWYSITFAGQKVTVECVVASAAMSRFIERNLPDRAFAVADMLIADIAIVETHAVGDNIVMRIEALLLDA